MHVQIAELGQQPLGAVNLCSVEPLFDFKQARVIERTRTHPSILPLYGRAEKTAFSSLSERPGKLPSLGGRGAGA
jgi:hypothetical protein